MPLEADGDQAARPDRSVLGRIRAAFDVDAFLHQLALLGTSVVAVSYFLPWTDLLLGRGPAGALVGSLGVSGPWHLVPFLATLLAAGVIYAGRGVPRWLRVGGVPLGLGMLSIGIAWPYLASRGGSSFGVTVLLIGALLLVIAGLVGIRPRPEGTAEA